MNKFAVASIIGLGLIAYIPVHADEANKPVTGKSTTSTNSMTPQPSASSSASAKPATSSSASGQNNQPNGTAAAAAESKTGDPAATKSKAKHHKKVAHKHKKDVLIGDGEPLSKLGEHKDVDGGFDFNNSKTFKK